MKTDSIPAPTKIDNYFLCIGAQKSGTTWLARMLSAHPDLFFTPVKEIHYFDHISQITQHLCPKKRRSRYRKYLQKMATQWNKFTDLNMQRAWYRSYMRSPLDDNWYCSLFAERGSATFAGEATPEYAIIGREGFEHIKRLAPGVRLIYILRNPVERCWSQILHHCRSNKLDVANQSDETLIELSKSERFRELGDYTRTLEDLDAVFMGSQRLVMFYEDIHANRSAALEEICRFIGTSFEQSDFPDLSARYNISQNGKIPDALRQHLRETYRDMATTIGERFARLPKSWKEEFGF